MMGNPEKTTGIALVCQPDGRIEAVVDDPDGIIAGQAAGENMAAYVDRGCLSAWLNFLALVNSGNPALDWSISLKGDQIPLEYRLSGIRDNGYLFLAGTKAYDIRKKTSAYVAALDIHDAPNLVESFSKMRAALEKESVGEAGIYDELSRLNNNLINLQRELVKKNRQLEEALSSIKTLKGLVPICSSCKKIRNDSGYWQQVEEYVAEHTEADFSHGLCDECAHKLYPQYFKPKKNRTPGDEVG